MKKKNSESRYLTNSCIIPHERSLKQIIIKVIGPSEKSQFHIVECAVATEQQIICYISANFAASVVFSLPLSSWPIVSGKLKSIDNKSHWFADGAKIKYRRVITARQEIYHM